MVSTPRHAETQAGRAISIEQQKADGTGTRRSSLRHLLFVVLGLLGVLVLAAGIAVVVVARTDPRARVESFAGARLGHTVTIQSLNIHWGNPVTVDMTGVHIANVAWGSRPDIASVEHIRGDIAFWPLLLRGQIRLNNIAVERPLLILERDAHGVGNWASAQESRHEPHAAQPLPVDFIGGMTMRDGELTIRTTKHNSLRIRMTTSELSANDDSAPVTLRAEGAYNDIALTGTVVLESFQALRRLPRPVSADIAVNTKQSRMTIVGTTTDPLNFDGVRAKLRVTAPTLRELSEIAGTPEIANMPYDLTGMLDRQGDHWVVNDIGGTFADTPVNGSLALNEGGRGVPDHFDANLDFGSLDLHRVQAGLSSKDDQNGISLRVQEQPDETFSVRIGIKEALYRREKLHAFVLEAALEPAKLTVGKLAFGLADGRIEASGTVQTAGQGGHVVLDATASRMNVSQLLALLGGDKSTLTGNLNAGLSVDMTGQTTKDALASSGGQLVMSMTGGQVSRKLLELASTDTRLLVREAPGYAQVTCLVAVANMRNGIVSLSPFHLKTGEGNLIGGGQIDLRRDVVNVLLRSDGQSTSFWALDIPLRITGSLSDPHALPSAGADTRELEGEAAENLRVLAPRLKQIKAGGC